MTKNDIRIGYACMNLDIHPNSYKTCRKSNISDSKLKEIISYNLKLLDETLDYNIKNGNKLFRISSSLIPFGSSSLNTIDWGSVFSNEFNILKDKIEKNDIRVSMHPGQYTVINSIHDHVVTNSILDLEYHAKILDLLAPTNASNIILHVGGVYDNKQEAINRFINVYNNLSSNIKKYLVIENDDISFTVEDVLYISSKVNVPVVFDNLHHKINPSLEEFNISILMSKVVSTWKDKKPKFHYSQQDETKRVGAHSKTINLNKFIFDYNKLFKNFNVDIMLEVKDKNRSFIKINQYFFPNQKIIENEWARYKYLVLKHSVKSYNDIRLLFKDNNEVDVVAFYNLVDLSLNLPDDIGAQINAAQHIWGYFKDISTINEKNSFIQAIDDKDLNKANIILKRLSLKYNIKYLINSYYFN